MGEAKGVESGELEHIANQMNGYPRDLLKRFTSSSSSSNNHLPEIKIEEETEEIELNLGLSLGGRFGVDPKESKLVRSTSIAGLATATTLFNDGGVPKSVGVSASIFRTTSLPTETEEEWRKRKEMQCLRRMEAKRKRSEKQKNIRAGGVGNKDRGSDRASMEEEKRIDGVLPLPSFMGSSGGGSAPTAMQKQQQPQQQHLNGVALPLGLPPWGKGSVVGSSPNAKASNVLTSSPAGQGLPPPSSQQGSVGSQGSSSTSGISEFESRPAQGFSNCAEARSPVSVQSLPEQNEQKATISPTSTTKVETGNPVRVETENAAKKPKVMENGMRESGMKVMEEMPCVSTKGDGPDGRRVEGFLYKYKKGEEAVIVCVCHGKFLSPAEFVRHAGGGDVAHPLRHIVVNPSPSFS